MKSPADAQVLAQKLPPLMPELFKAADAIGTLHYSRFVGLSAKTFLFLADYDGEFEQLLRDMAQHFGPVFETIFAHVDNPPPMPVANNVAAFVEWATDHFLKPVGVYTAYVNATVQDIKSRAAAAGITGTGEQLPFLVIMPLKSRLALIEVELLLKVATHKLTEGSDTIGTLHFAHFVPLENHQLGFFTVYDGPFDKYIQDFAEKLGPVFDLLFKFVVDPPPTPTAKNAEALITWVAAHDLPPIGMYSAYPGLRVQDVNALLADG
jgi:hypothetical protein